MLFALLVVTLKSYAQDCSDEYSSSHLLGFNVERQLENCVEWQDPDPTLADDSLGKTSKCAQYVSCALQIPDPNELVKVSCVCRKRRSTKHPEYDPSDQWPFWRSNGSACTYNEAEEKAIKGCDFVNLESDNPEHWLATTDCRRVYKYICENDDILYTN